MRRWMWTAVLVMAVLSVVSGPTKLAEAAPRTSATTWTQEGFGPGHTSYNPDESVINATSIGRLKLRWTATTPNTPDLCNSMSPPLATAGRLYSTDPTGVVSYAATTGRRLWHWTMPHIDPTRKNQEHFGVLAAAGNLLVALTNPCEYGQGQFAYLTGLDAATGRQRWRVPMDQYTNIMVIDRGVAAVGNWGGFNDAPQSTTGYRVTDGARLWTTTGYRLNYPVSAGGRLLLSRADDQAARAVSITTGRALWNVAKAWSPQAASPAGDRFLVSTASDGVTSVDAATGTPQWTTNHDGSIADDGRTVYLTYHRAVEAFDARTGRLLRTMPLGKRGGSQPVRAGGLIYLTVTGYNAMEIISPLTGRHVGAPAIRGGPPVIVNGWLYVTDGETLHAYAP
jgi:outer membrane protein assembly factor BamB